MSAIRAVAEPGAPTLQDERLNAPCEILPTALMKDGSDYPESSAMIIGGL
jgi:hypothetical protein